MPLGWECRDKLIKQIPLKPTERRGISGETRTPEPTKYTIPSILGGNGYSKIKRSPAYTFGHLTKLNLSKPVASPNARMFNVRGLTKQGTMRITHCVVSPQIEPIQNKGKIPGPAAYTPTHSIKYKCPPAYSLRPAAAPPREATDQWTPPANMYYPPIPCKKPPAYTLGYTTRTVKTQDLPGPGEHKPNFDYVKRNKPAFSFGNPFRHLKPPKSPTPNTYCEKKFMITKSSIPAPSFGIRHSPFLGKQQEYLTPSKLNLQGTNNI